MRARVALATVGDSRDDFFALRQQLLQEELGKLGWLRERTDLLESGMIRTKRQAAEFARQAGAFQAQALVVYLPIWADPLLTVKLWNYSSLPVLLLGNSRPETSSLVGVLGAGGALDQIGCRHRRIFDPTEPETQRSVLAFARACAARHALRGQTMGMFGGRSLGITTASADPAQWQQIFGVDILPIDQAEIVERAESLPAERVLQHADWLTSRLGGTDQEDRFNSKAYDRQVRSYLATLDLMQTYELDFVGVKCQPELSDHYATQCVAHMLFNGNEDSLGKKTPIVHACESDADGALSMQILHLLSEGQPTALLDLRWHDPVSGLWTLANCGALAAAFYATAEDPSGLSAVHRVPHVFGNGGGAAYPAPVAPQQVTLARLCRKDGKYWMAIVAGETLFLERGDLARTTYAFPQARLRSSAGRDFLETYGSNHIHMVSGDYQEELVAFCDLLDIPYKVWS
jgi:L-fucose isomerase